METKAHTIILLKSQDNKDLNLDILIPNTMISFSPYCLLP